MSPATRSQWGARRLVGERVAVGESPAQLVRLYRAGDRQIGTYVAGQPGAEWTRTRVEAT